MTISFPHKISKDNQEKLVDKLIYIAAILSPIITLPQLFTIWLNKNASGVSIISWTSYFIVAFFWLLYGKVHNYKPIIITYAIWMILDLLIIIGTVIYG